MLLDLRFLVETAAPRGISIGGSRGKHIVYRPLRLRSIRLTEDEAIALAGGDPQLLAALLAEAEDN